MQGRGNGRTAPSATEKGEKLMNLIAMALWIVGIGFSWLTMIYGWGLEPKSWGWIIGGTGASLVAMGIATVINEIRKS